MSFPTGRHTGGVAGSSPTSAASHWRKRRVASWPGLEADTWAQSGAPRRARSPSRSRALWWAGSDSMLTGDARDAGGCARGQRRGHRAGSAGLGRAGTLPSARTAWSAPPRAPRRRAGRGHSPRSRPGSGPHPASPARRADGEGRGDQVPRPRAAVCEGSPTSKQKVRAPSKGGAAPTPSVPVSTVTVAGGSCKGA